MARVTPEDLSTWNTDPADQKGMPNGYAAANITTVLSPAEAAAYSAPGVGNKIFSMLKNILIGRILTNYFLFRSGIDGR
ncbi:hypothetical protein BH20BAC1_BH20BAC1_12890 [soil metagenome]